MYMRLTLVVPAILTACVVAVSWSTKSGHAESQCLAAPNATAPEGRHWYYRLDRATGRRCWYLGAKGMTVRQAIPRRPLPSPRPAEPADAPEATSRLSDIVTLFSRYWPKLPQAADKVGEVPASTGKNPPD